MDLETTGGSAQYDRVMEVAAIRVENGVVQDRFERLAEPGVPIPPFVTRITGINAALVRGKPSFDSLLPDLRRLFDGAVVVAHNASFDCNFLSAGLLPRRARLARRAAVHAAAGAPPDPRACTATSWTACARSWASRSSSAIAPGPTPKRRCRCSSTCSRRPSAAASTASPACCASSSSQSPTSAARAASTRPRSPACPPTPGVYLLKDLHGQVVYVGKSVNVRQRVRTHLRPSGTARSAAQPRLRRRLPHIADVEAIETKSELEALLLESKLVKRYLPEANSLLRDYHDYPFIKIDIGDPSPAPRGDPRTANRRHAVLRTVPPRGRRLVGGGVPERTARLAPVQRAAAAGPGGVRAAGDEEVPGAVRRTRCRKRTTPRRSTRACACCADRTPRVLERAAQRRDELGEQLRFEEAAELRDRIRDVEQVIGVQQRLAAFADRNVVLVTPDRQPDRMRLLLVRAGTPGRAGVAAGAGDAVHLRHLLRRAYRRAPSSAQVSRDELDDLLILDAWLRRHRDEFARWPIPIDDPDGRGWPALRAAMCRLRAASKRSMPRPTTSGGRCQVRIQSASARPVAGAIRMPVL